MNGVFFMPKVLTKGGQDDLERPSKNVMVMSKNLTHE